MRLAPHLAALLASSPLALAQTASTGVIDTLEPQGALAASRSQAPARVVVGTANDFIAAPRLDVFEAPAGSVDFVRTAQLLPPGWLETWYVHDVAVQGELIAHQVDKRFENDTELFVHELTPGGWTTSSLDLPGPKWLLYGKLTAISGPRMATITSPGFNAPVRLRLVERGAGGTWGVTQTVTTDIRAPWLEASIDLVLDGSVAAIGGTQGPTAGRVAVCEADASGAWSQTATLPTPGADEWTVDAMALEDGVLAVVRASTSANGPRRYVLHLYEKSASSGTWDVTGRASLPPQTSFFPAWSVDLDGPRVAVSDFSEMRVAVYLKSGTGALQLEHTVEGLRSVSGFESGRLIGRASGAGSSAPARVVLVPQAPGTTASGSLAGLQTCAGSGQARLRIHALEMRSVAEVTGAAPGATAFVLRSADPAMLPAFGGSLCVDRSAAVRVDVPRPVDAAGTALFDLGGVQFPPLQQGFEAADHFQAIVLGPAPVLTNALAWIR